MVGYPHELKGQGIYCFVTLQVGIEPSDALRKELVGSVGKVIGRPRRRTSSSGHRACPGPVCNIAANEHDASGVTSTLADPSVIDDLVRNRMNR